MEKVLNKTAAITGTIGSGKSQLCKYLKELGAGVVCADKQAHEVLEEMPTRIQISQEFGLPITFTREELGKIVFQDKAKLQTLNAITHPIIRSRVETKLSELALTKEILIYDVPLFFESGLNALPFLCSVVVFCDEKIAVERISKRDPHLSLEEIKQRIGSQMPIKDKVALADISIDNNGDLKQLQASAQNLYKLLLENLS